MKRILASAALMIVLGACTGQAEDLTPVTLMLDWVPNTNHTGIYIAQREGYFEEGGLEVKIIEPGEVYAEQAVVGGAADFGISFQEGVTMARADALPLVSIAAIIQHNTSGFASLKETTAKSPADWETLRYGALDLPFETPTLRELMNCDGGNFDSLEMLSTGTSDPLALLEQRKIDLVWIFFGWDGPKAAQKGIELEVVMMEDWLDCIPDYYTPVIITAESTIDERPDMVRTFLEAVSRGYNFAIENPAAAADILLEAVPELDRQLVKDSQAWLSSRYQADASRWGEQDLQVWRAYSEWMVDHDIQDLFTDPIQAERAFTNEYLP